MIKLLIVEDSPVIRDFLGYIFSMDSEIEIIGYAGDGIEAIEKVKELSPNVVTMDINMPKMNGLDATKAIMSKYPVPIVIVSGSENISEIGNSFDAIEAGALSVMPRPVGLGHPDFEASSKELIRTVKAMSEVKVVRRWIRNAEMHSHIKYKNPAAKIKFVLIGASTGGPVILQSILAEMPKDFSLPILIVQHMSEGFISGFAEWLNLSSKLLVHIAANGELILPGNVYAAPDKTHMGVNSNGKIILEASNPINGHIPSVSYLFRSAAENFGSGAIGILLTGMGKDGAAELKLMRDNNAITIAQDKGSSVIFGMPGEAVRLEAASHVLPPDKIISFLLEFDRNNKFEKLRGEDMK